MGNHHRHHHHHTSSHKKGATLRRVLLFGALGLVGLVVILGAIRIVAGMKSDAAPKILNKVTIDSTPEQGAEVLVAGQDRGPTPVTVEGLPPGKQEVVLRRDRFERLITEIEVTGAPEETFTLEMAPLQGFLSVETTPAGAEVFVDGDKVGSTPLFTHPLQVGEHTYDLKLADYYPFSGKITIDERFKHEVKHQFKPLEAVLNVFSRPTGAQIWLNNLLQPQLTPAKFTLPQGSYLISVYTKGFVQQESVVELKENANETVQLAMEPGNVPVGMVLIPGGEFAMGTDDRAPDERPKRMVTLKPYYIDKFEVTNEEYQRVFKDYTFPDGEGNLPVTGVSWTEAMRYAGLAGKRLPTEAEWERAARGNDVREYPWGAIFNPGMANTREEGVKRPVRVGLYFHGNSPYKCMDMAGNAYEWVSDWYEAYPGNLDVTKDYGQVYRVLRGGSYKTEKFEARCPARHFDRMDAKGEDYGFRCAQDVPQQ